MRATVYLNKCRNGNTLDPVNRGKPKSKRHPVASVADEECLKEEDCDGDTDGTEIYDPEETVEHLKKQSRSKQSKALTLAKRKGAKHPIGSQDRNKKTKKPRVTKAKSTLSVSSSADALACGLVKVNLAFLFSFLAWSGVRLRLVPLSNQLRRILFLVSPTAPFLSVPQLEIVP